MALAHEVAGCEGELSPQFHVAEARLHMHREDYDRAAHSLRKAIALDYQVTMEFCILITTIVVI